MFLRIILLLSLSVTTFLGIQNAAFAQSLENVDEELDESEVYDPLEPFNRGVFRFNEVFDNIILKPTARGYRKVVPVWGRERVHLFLRNLTEPVTFFNAVLQADADRAFTSFWRFTINSTWGVGGMFDIAGQEGLVYRDEDFGQTLGRYGVGTGPYLVLPILGPSNPRDAVGKVADAFMDPFYHIFDEQDEVIWTRYIVTAIDTREQLLDITDEVEQTSFDLYATYRSIYVQNRESKVNNGGSPEK